MAICIYTHIAKGNVKKKKKISILKCGLLNKACLYRLKRLTLAFYNFTLLYAVTAADGKGTF